jgi:excisionase family DNA binding protein
MTSQSHTNPKALPNASYDFFNENQVAQRLGVSIATVRRWRAQHIGPRFRKIGSSVRYSSDDLKQWIEAQPAGGGSGQ